MLKLLNNIALKYNWWTKKEDKENISDYIKISYIYSKWNIYELFLIIKKLDYQILLKAFEYIKNDNFSLKEKRKKVIFYLLNLKKNGII